MNRDKPFYNMMMYSVKRHKYNPFRLIFGDWYYTHNIQKWLNQQILDPKDIKFINKSHEEH